MACLPCHICARVSEQTQRAHARTHMHARTHTHTHAHKKRPSICDMMELRLSMTLSCLSARGFVGATLAASIGDNDESTLVARLKCLPQRKNTVTSRDVAFAVARMHILTHAFNALTHLQAYAGARRAGADADARARHGRAHNKHRVWGMGTGGGAEASWSSS
jgi:hypothetical protein